MEGGTVVCWNKSPGESFERGEILVEIETDKMVAEVPALTSGVLLEILCPDQSRVAVGEALAWLEVETSSAPVAPAKTSAVRSPLSSTPIFEQTASFLDSSTRRTDRIRAVPGARRLAQRHGLALEEIQGTGPSGRIERADVLRLLSDREKAERSKGAWGPVQGPQGLRVWRRGTGHGTPVVLLHGFSADLHSWRMIQGPLGRSRDVLALELPGHGESEILTIQGGIPALTEIVSGVLKELGLKNFDLVGHSLGGGIALSLAAQHPESVRRLTLLAPMGLGPEVQENLLQRLVTPLGPAETQLTLSRLFYNDQWLAPDFLEAAQKNVSQAVRCQAAQQLLQHLVQEGRQLWSGRSLLETLRAPVRILWGEEDLVFPIRQLQGVPGWVAQHRLAGVGHIPQIESAALVLRLLQSDE